MKPTPILSLPKHYIDSVKARLAARVIVTRGGCWEWQGARDRHGYGRITVSIDGRKRETGAHRAAWIVHRGDIPSTLLQTDHLCRVRHCVNPDHMELVTNSENGRRSPLVGKGTWARGRPRATSCKAGHLFDEENTHVYRRKDGYTVQICIACRRRRSRESRLRQDAG